MPRKRNSVSDVLRAAIDADERSRYRIALDAEIDHASMSRFMAGTGVTSDTVDRLAETLGLELTPKRRLTHTRKGN